MAKTYYLDTCVWRDFFEDRLGRSGKPLGGYAAQLFLKILKDKDSILFSESLIWELKKRYTLEEIQQIMSLLFHTQVLKRISTTKEEFLEAKNLARNRNLPLIDCLQVIQARNHDAVMVSQDKHIIECLKDIVKTIRPEQII